MQTSQCKAKTKNGTRCQAHAGEDGYCFFHSPTKAEDRAKAHRRGGLAKLIKKVSGEPIQIVNIADVLRLINAVILDSWELENTPARSRALLAAGEAAINAMQAGELAQRVKALEQRLQVVGEKQQWAPFQKELND